MDVIARQFIIGPQVHKEKYMIPNKSRHPDREDVLSTTDKTHLWGWQP